MLCCSLSHDDVYDKSDIDLVIVSGPPGHIAACKVSHTGRYPKDLA